jgi:hypothetical protein
MKEPGVDVSSEETLLLWCQRKVAILQPDIEIIAWQFLDMRQRLPRPVGFWSQRMVWLPSLQD